MSIHTARAFLVERLLPSYEEFLDVYSERTSGERRDTIKGAVAAENCLHLIDHVYKDCESQFAVTYKNVKGYRESLTKDSRELEIICDVANVFKHRTISRDGRTISSLDAIKEACAIVRYKDSRGRYYDARKILSIHLDSGKRISFEKTLRTALLYLVKELVRLEIIDSPPRIRSLRGNLVTRNAASLKWQFLGRKGEAFHEQFEALIYDRTHDSIRPKKAGERFGKANVDCVLEVLHSKFESVDGCTVA